MSPHFDDGVLSLGGLMAKREHKLEVATFFTKRPTEIIHTNWDKISGFSDSDEAVLARTKENKKALIPFGAIIKNYDYPDFQYRKTNENQIIRENIIKNIQSIIENNKNRELYIYGPATFGEKITHPDHQIMHDALMGVIKENTQTNTHFFIYEDFPYVRQFALAQMGSLNTYLKEKENIEFKELPIELNKTELSEKVSSIHKYISQVKAFLSFGDNIGNLAQKFYQERCKNIHPMFYACEVVNMIP